MKVEDLNLLIQIIDAEEAIAEELENAVKKNDSNRIKKAKEEILNLQRQMVKLTE